MNQHSGAQQFTSIERFLFNTPLYTQLLFPDPSDELLAKLYGRPIATYGNTSIAPARIDGFCPNCKLMTTFFCNEIDIRTPQVPAPAAWNMIETRVAFDNLWITCARNPSHRVLFIFFIANLTIQKVGQFPSLADIAIEENRQRYKSVLKGENWQELYKAIGLAAHGEGIGAFVYLRRVFERLIKSRFDQHQPSLSLNESDFKKLPMDQKVLLLKEHLPASLVEHRRLYSIFSIGVHDLENDRCLEFFEAGKRSIIMILEDDLRLQHEAAARTELKEAIATFDPE